MNKEKTRQGLCILLGLILLFSILVGCGPETKVSDKPVVYTSFFPIYDLTKTVASDVLEVRSFMPTNAAVHDWEPSPKSMKDLEKADLLIVNGANMERWLPSVQKNLPNLKVLKLSENADLISYTGAAAIGDFQIMARANMDKKSYPMIFGHTHEEYIRVVFLKDNGQPEEDLIDKGRTLMEDIGEIIKQRSTVDVKPEQVYRIEMGHNSGFVNFDMPESGDWIIYLDRKSEEILTYQLTEDGENEVDIEILLSGSSQGVDQITYDPHSWISIKNGKTYINTIARELSRLYPEYQRVFDRNRFKAVDELTLLELDYSQKFKELEEDQRNFIVMHYAYEYLAREFGLKQYPLQGLTSMADPSIRSIVGAIEYAKATDTHTIFYEYGSPTAVAQSISEELVDGNIAPLASMEYPIPGRSAEENSYYEMMRLNLESLYGSLVGDYNE